jgi:hypothetical protein
LSVRIARPHLRAPHPGSSLLDAQAKVWDAAGQTWRGQLALLAHALAGASAARLRAPGGAHALDGGDRELMALWLLSVELGVTQRDIARLTGRARATVQSQMARAENLADALAACPRAGPILSGVEAELAAVRAALDGRP